MSTFLVWSLIGLAAVVVSCYVHSHVDTEMPRAKFVFCTLATVGMVALSYTALWAVAGQHPDFSFAPIAGFGLTMVITALVYSACYVLSQRDIAPSR